MKTLQTILFTIILSTSFCTTQAQTNTIDLLKSVKWQRDFGNNKNFSIAIIFSTNKMTGVLAYDNVIDKYVEAYYLSDSLETEFKPTKIGKTSSGRYIISQDSNGKMSVYEILHLDKGKLVKKPADKTDKKDNHLTYFAIPK